MMKVLILYYLSIKSTHGYEIQKFIQISHMDSWTKIQSGSIYYALAKLEKEGLIELTSELCLGAKARKMYSITEKGRMELKLLVRKELSSSIGEVGSDKFILYPLLNVSDKEEVEQVVTSYIVKLKEKKADILRWQTIKVNEHTLEVEKISFQMMLSSLEYQIKWHQALLSQLDRCMADSEEVARLIRIHDFSDSEVMDMDHITNLESMKKYTLK